MRSLVRLGFVASVILGCGSNDDEAAGPAPPGACQPASQCAGCTACFDACLCGGGTTARCAEECGAVPPEQDAGTDAPGSAVGRYAATLVMDAFDIPPGEEYFRCQNFSNPFGRNVAVLSTETFMTAGSHHLFVFQGSLFGETISEGPLEPCGGLEFGPYLHSSQRSQQKTSYPPGVGSFHEAGTGLRVQVHYLNTSPDTVHAEVAVTLRADDLEAVQTLASQIFINTGSIDVPPFSPGHATNTCPVAKDVNLFSASSHMHKRGVYFTARDSDGQLLFETNDWEEPVPWRFEPPRRLRAGTRIQIDCDYQNDTPFTLSFGESADTNEMCIFTGSYYPAEPYEAITCIF